MRLGNGLSPVMTTEQAVETEQETKEATAAVLRTRKRRALRKLPTVEMTQEDFNKLDLPRSDKSLDFAQTCPLYSRFICCCEPDLPRNIVVIGEIIVENGQRVTKFSLVKILSVGRRLHRAH